jgi:zinc transport system ATP-binding protein
MDIIKCENLCMCYDNNVVFCDLSFSVAGGEFLSVVGENGSGKSTLVKGILGLMKHKGGLELCIKHNQIGYLPQQTPVAEDFPVSVGEVVLAGCLNDAGAFPFFKDKHRGKASNALAKMRVLDLKHRRFRDLSAGQRQRVLIARALCAAERLLLLDEPVTGIDPVVRNELYELIVNLNKADGMAVIMVTHDLDGAVMYSDKILHISAQGSQSFFGTVAEYTGTQFYREMRCACDN